jgi:hypothetical protein
MDPEIGSDVRDRTATLARQPDATLEQLLGVLPRSRHDSGGSPLPRTASWLRGPRETRSGSLNECWRPAFARHLYPRYSALSRELDRYLSNYNTDRVHHGLLTNGRIPTDIVCGANKMKVTR